MALGFALSIGRVLFGMTQTQLIIIRHPWADKIEGEVKE
jgi:hypothetical protein